MPESARPYLAIDLGAESGRAVLGRVQDGVITTEEIRRFPNSPIHCAASLRWDVTRLWSEIRECLTNLDVPKLAGIGVDAWGVDYALLGDDGDLLENPYHYRDKRTDGVMDLVFDKVSKEEIYKETGIQFMQINTLYQLFAARRDTPEVLSRARTLLTIPDLFHYWLTGNMKCEFTNATTTQMVSAKSRQWARGLIEKAGLSSSLPAEIVEPGSVLGALSGKVDCASALHGTPVIAPASHDTGSAVAAIAAREGTVFISSGTWSLVGTEIDAPLINDEALRLNFTNEGGVCGTNRLLKNVMGLWMLQCCRRCWSSENKDISYGELMDLASAEPAFAHLLDPDDPSFLHPENMPSAIDAYCNKTAQPAPVTAGAYTRAVLESIALKYRQVIRQIEKLTQTRVSKIRIIGGGSKNHLLNQFTADATGKTVLAGPVEATALGNLAMQILATGVASSLAEVRAIIERSFPIEVFEPRETDKWERHAARFRHYTEMAYA
jgi:rhamnulokinase